MSNMVPRLVFPVVLSIALLQFSATLAVQRDYFPTPSDYSVKIPAMKGTDIYVEVPAATGEVFACYEFRRINNWQRPPEQSADPSAFQLKLRRVGDAIEMDLSVVFGPIEQFRTLPTKGLQGQHIGSYSVRLSETVNLQELAGFGIEPISVTVVSSRSRILDSSEIENGTRAIELVRAEKARDHYRLLLKNISSKNIVGLSVKGGLSSVSNGTLIAPGQVYTMGFSDYGWRPAQEPGSVEQTPTLVIANVVFADLTYEGEKEFAIKVAASRQAVRIQWARIVPLLQAALEGLRQDREKALNDLRQQVSALGEEPESSIVDAVAKYFVPITDKQRIVLVCELRDILQSEKLFLLALLKYHEHEESTKGTSRESWLKHMSDAYERALKKPLN